MEIILKQLKLKNFKGIKDLEIDFSKTTNIYGENATGKTTIFDAFSWVLFDKDSKGRSKFEVQPLDEKNNVKHGLDSDVTAVLNINGADRTFSKTLSEKWVKQRGQAEAELKGTTTSYEIDGVPTKLKDYQTTINSIINENLFKMVTNPVFFPTMNWQDQRKILLDIIGDLEEDNVISYNPSLNPLRDLLTDGIDNFTKRTKASISKLKDQIKSLPYRIDECNNSITEIDVEALNIKKAEIVVEINSIDEQITDSSKANEKKLKLQDKLFEFKNKRNSLILEYKANSNKPLEEINNKINSLKNNIKAITEEKFLMDRKINQAKKGGEEALLQKENYEKKQESLRTQWKEENSKEFYFDENSAICPCCNRPYETDDIDKLKLESLEKFNKNKKEKLDEVSRQGKGYGNILKEVESSINQYADTVRNAELEIAENINNIKVLNDEVAELEMEKENLSTDNQIIIPGLEDLDISISRLEEDIRTFKSNDNTELKIKKRTLQEQLEGVNRQLNAKDNNEKLLIRIEELKEEEKELNIKIAQLEGQLFLGEEFIRTKVELLEGKINKKFEGKVSFKLFNQQVNGGLSECCEVLIEGVPFGNANTASQINAGLTIINTLSNHYSVQAPIFIDNRESVNDLVGIDSQVINLIVSKDKKMKVEVI